MQSTEVDLTRAAPMVCKLLPRLASNFDGKVVATVRAIDRTLKSADRSWHDLVNKILVPLPKLEPAPQAAKAKPDWRPLAERCIACAHRLKPREIGFPRSLVERNIDDLSEKQMAWLLDIVRRLGISQ
jgi:hypothetical protein